MAVLTVNKIVQAGLVSTLVSAAGGGDSFPNTGHEFMEVTNGDSGAHVVTFVASGPACNYGLAGTTAHDQTVSVAAGATKKIGPFPTAKFNDSNGRVQVTYDGVTSVTVGVFAAA